jgi:hypothetical protein
MTDGRDGTGAEACTWTMDGCCGGGTGDPLGSVLRYSIGFLCTSCCLLLNGEGFLNH